MIKKKKKKKAPKEVLMQEGGKVHKFVRKKK